MSDTIHTSFGVFKVASIPQQQHEHRATTNTNNASVNNEAVGGSGLLTNNDLLETLRMVNVNVNVNVTAEPTTAPEDTAAAAVIAPAPVVLNELLLPPAPDIYGGGGVQLMTHEEYQIKLLNANANASVTADATQQQQQQQQHIENSTNEEESTTVPSQSGIVDDVDSAATNGTSWLPPADLPPTINQHDGRFLVPPVPQNHTEKEEAVILNSDDESLFSSEDEDDEQKGGEESDDDASLFGNTGEEEEDATLTNDDNKESDDDGSLFGDVEDGIEETARAGLSQLDKESQLQQMSLENGLRKQCDLRSSSENNNDNAKSLSSIPGHPKERLGPPQKEEIAPPSAAAAAAAAANGSSPHGGGMLGGLLSKVETKRDSIMPFANKGYVIQRKVTGRQDEINRELAKIPTQQKQESPRMLHAKTQRTKATEAAAQRKGMESVRDLEMKYNKLLSSSNTSSATSIIDANAGSGADKKAISSNAKSMGKSAQALANRPGAMHHSIMKSGKIQQIDPKQNTSLEGGATATESQTTTVSSAVQKKSPTVQTTWTEEEWKEQYIKLKKFKKLHGNCIAPDGHSLMPWIDRQRRVCKLFIREVNDPKKNLSGKKTLERFSRILRLERMGYYWGKEASKDDVREALSSVSMELNPAQRESMGIFTNKSAVKKSQERRKDFPGNSSRPKTKKSSSGVELKSSAVHGGGKTAKRKRPSPDMSGEEVFGENKFNSKKPNATLEASDTEASSTTSFDDEKPSSLSWNKLPKKMRKNGMELKITLSNMSSDQWVGLFGKCKQRSLSTTCTKNGKLCFDVEKVYQGINPPVMKSIAFSKQSAEANNINKPSNLKLVGRKNIKQTSTPPSPLKKNKARAPLKVNRVVLVNGIVVNPIGEEVYAAWRRGKQKCYYPGIVQSHKLVEKKKGHSTVVYDVLFDDGDKGKGIEAHLVMPVGKYTHQNLKPMLKVGEKVYSGWWEDDDRATPAMWFPGVVKKRKTNSKYGGPYGPIWRYDIEFDDGDKLDDIQDCFVMNATEYLLSTRKSVDDGTVDVDEQKWIGVRNKVDPHCIAEDQWARDVGWYVATIDGKEQSFSLLSNALRAFDAYTVRLKAEKTKVEDLNLQEEWVFAKPTGVCAPVHIGDVPKSTKSAKARPKHQQINDGVVLARGSNGIVTGKATIGINGDCPTKVAKSKMSHLAAPTDASKKSPVDDGGSSKMKDDTISVESPPSSAMKAMKGAVALRNGAMASPLSTHPTAKENKLSSKTSENGSNSPPLGNTIFSVEETKVVEAEPTLTLNEGKGQAKSEAPNDKQAISLTLGHTRSAAKAILNLIDPTQSSNSNPVEMEETGTTKKEDVKMQQTNSAQSSQLTAVDRALAYPAMPAEGMPLNWIVRKVPRPNGKHSDSYYYSPKEGHKFRSKTAVHRFLDCLNMTNGDEKLAFEELHGSSKKSAPAEASVATHSPSSTSSSTAATLETTKNTSSSTNIKQSKASLKSSSKSRCHPTLTEKEAGYPALPAEDYPAGWTVRDIPRNKGSHKDRYYYSTNERCRFRSKTEVARFLDCLKVTNGDERLAIDEFHEITKSRKRALDVSVLKQPPQPAKKCKGVEYIAPCKTTPVKKELQNDRDNGKAKAGPYNKINYLPIEKPVINKGERVYARYFGSDGDGEGWYPGRVWDLKVDESSGIKTYDIVFDDGDTDSNLGEAWVSKKSEYDTCLNHPDNTWIGVSNVRLKGSKDDYLRLIGWYESEGSNKKYTSLGDALRAHDKYLIESRGKVAVEELNYPEEQNINVFL